jgi:hypothetical protein
MSWCQLMGVVYASSLFGLLAGTFRDHLLAEGTIKDA